MSSRTAGLVVDVATAGINGAVDDLLDLAKASKDASSGVADLGNDAQESARRIGVSADAADEFAGKTGKATGALGALSSGFELVGLGEYAGGLQAASMATDFMSGAGDALNLVMESTAIKTGIAKLSMVGHAIASGASSAATGVMTAAQWALNAALSANPIGLIVIALIALVAGLVLAYKKSGTVRDIVAEVGRIGKEAIGWVVDAVSDLVDWAGDKLPGAFNLGKNLIVGYLKLVTLPIRTVINLVMDLIRWVRDTLPKAFETFKAKADGVVDAVLAPFQNLYDLVKDIIDLIGKIKIPDIKGSGIPFVPGLRVAVPGGFDDGTTTGGGRVIEQTVIHLNGLLDAHDAVRTLEELLTGAGRRFVVVPSS